MYLTIIFILLVSNPFGHASLYLYPSIYLKSDTNQLNAPEIPAIKGGLISEGAFNLVPMFILRPLK